MSAASDLFGKANALLRSWGQPVEEGAGCWSHGNGSSWAAGVPQAFTNHHFVISLGSPFENGASNVRNGDSKLAGPKANYYGGIDPATGRRRLRFIAVNPANHAGMGRIETHNRMMGNAEPLGWIAEKYSPVADNWGGANRTYAGVEWHHPGDATPWSNDFINLVVDLNVAMCMAAGWNANRSHQHAEHSARKIDMSYQRGRGGFIIRERVRARLSGGPPPPTDDWWTDWFGG